MIQIPNYEIIKEIGRGSYGIVYKAQNPISGDIKAVKVLQEKYIGDEKARNMFLTEARVMANFNHPNIVNVSHPGLEPVPHFFMDYHPGSLEDKLNGKPLKVDEAIRIAKQLLEALSYAHKKGVIHRDVWPPNILLDENGNVRLADFGIAKIIQQTGEYSAIASKIGTGSGSIKVSREEEKENGLSKMIGALNYASPEMKRSEEVDARTDIYSAGVVLDEMLTGFVGGRESPSEVNPKVPEYLDVIVNRAIQSDRNKRYKSIAEFLADFDIKPEKPRLVEVKEKVVVRPKDYSFLGTIGKWFAGAGLLAALTVFSVKGCSSWIDSRAEARFSHYQNEYVLAEQDFGRGRYTQADERLEELMKRMAKDTNPRVASLLAQVAKYDDEKIDPEIRKIEEQRKQNREKAEKAKEEARNAKEGTMTKTEEQKKQDFGRLEKAGEEEKQSSVEVQAKPRIYYKSPGLFFGSGGLYIKDSSRKNAQEIEVNNTIYATLDEDTQVLSPDKEHIVFGGDWNKIYVVDSDGDDLRMVVPDFDHNVEKIGWVDNNTLWFTDYNKKGYRQIDIDSLNGGYNERIYYPPK